METFSALLAICAGIHQSPVNTPHKGQWRGSLMFSLICVCINGWVNNRQAGDLRRHRGHYDVTVMEIYFPWNILRYYKQIMIWWRLPGNLGWVISLMRAYQGPISNLNFTTPVFLIQNNYIVVCLYTVVAPITGAVWIWSKNVFPRDFCECHWSQIKYNEAIYDEKVTMSSNYAV